MYRIMCRHHLLGREHPNSPNQTGAIPFCTKYPQLLIKLFLVRLVPTEVAVDEQQRRHHHRHNQSNESQAAKLNQVLLLALVLFLLLLFFRLLSTTSPFH